MDDDDPYLSHPVRRIRDDPDPDPEATVDLAVEPAEGADPSDGTDPNLASVATDLGGTVVREGRFVTVVRLPERAVAGFVDRPGLARVETADTLGLGIDPAAADDPTAADDADPEPSTGSNGDG